MAKTRMSKGKFDGINACANERGVIAAMAIDQRGSLKKAIAKARGDGGVATSEDLTTFKTVVIRSLSKKASAVLIDPEYGLPAIPERAKGTGVLLAYEETGYDATVKGRLPDLLPEWSVRRLLQAGANVIKILLYYNPFDEPAINEIKHAFIERVGAECTANDCPFFLEPLVYDDTVGEEKGVEFAKVKPKYVMRCMEEFSKPEYGVDVLKVEVPVNMTYVEGTKAFGGQKVYTRDEALNLFREAATKAGKPFIYLSAGVTDEIFRETLELAAEAGTPFAGVLCGRATWQDGVAIFAKEGVPALETWLENRGQQNIEALNEVLDKGAVPWWEHYGGKDNIEVYG